MLERRWTTGCDDEAQNERAGVLPGSMGQFNSRRGIVKTTLSSKVFDDFRACMKKRDYEKLQVIVNWHPEVLHEVCEEGFTVLHVAVMTSCEDLVKKVLEVAFKDGNESATTLQLLDAEDKVYKLKAFEMAAIIGYQNIVIMLEHAVIDCLQGGKPYDYRSPLLGPYKGTGDPADGEHPLQHIRDLLQRELSEQSDGRLSWHEWMKCVNPPDTRPLGIEFVLHAAATDGDQHQIRRICEVLDEARLLSKLLELRDQHGRTPLHVAVECASPSGFKTFIEVLTTHGHGCLDMNVGDFAKRTPLHWAAALGKLEAVRALVEKRKTKINQSFSIGGTGNRAGYLSQGKGVKNIALGKLEAVNALVEDRRTDLNQSFSMGGTGNRAGYHFQGRGVKNMTALHLAAFHNHYQVVKVLIDETNHVQANATCIREVILGNGDAQCEDWSPFQIAAAKGHVQTMQVFIKAINKGCKGVTITPKKKSRIGSQGNSKFIPELHLAAISGNPIAVKVLLACEKIDPLSLDHHGNTALHYATRACDFREPSNACDFINLSHFKSRPPEKIKTVGGIIGCIDSLMQSGLDMEKQNDRNETPQLASSTPEKVHQWWYKKMVEQRREIKSDLVDAARSISVTAALVATASFIGPLQPPLGMTASTSGDSINSLEWGRIGVREFFEYNNGAFYFAIASITLAMIPSLPVQHENLFRGLRTFKKRIEGALFLLFTALMYIVCAFTAANIAVWKTQGLTKRMLVSNLILPPMITLVCVPAFYAFIRRLLQLASQDCEPWWRKPTIMMFLILMIVAIPLYGILNLIAEDFQGRGASKPSVEFWNPFVVGVLGPSLVCVLASWLGGGAHGPAHLRHRWERLRGWHAQNELH